MKLINIRKLHGGMREPDAELEPIESEEVTLLNNFIYALEDVLEISGTGEVEPDDEWYDTLDEILVIAIKPDNRDDIIRHLSRRGALYNLFREAISQRNQHNTIPHELTYQILDEITRVVPFQGGKIKKSRKSKSKRKSKRKSRKSKRNKKKTTKRRNKLYKK